MSDHVQAVVIGAGVVGLAVARALALQGREVLVLEAGDAIGTGISARNSEVIHAGIYYAPGSLKARFCVRGRQLLYDYCDQRSVSHRRCGKLIVATRPQEVPQLQALLVQAKANGVDDLRLLSSAQAAALEPALRCVAALHSPSTGTVDSHGLMLALEGDLQHAGGTVVLRTAVDRAVYTAPGWALTLHDGTTLHSQLLINAAGLGAVALARRFDGLDAARLPEARFAKGSYFSLAGRAPFNHLIYPVPEAGGLGVHLTLDQAGLARFGPDVEWVAQADDYAVDVRRSLGFYAEVRKYWPDLPDGALVPAYAGIRPKLAGPNGQITDFVIQGPQDHGLAGLVNLLGIESPGLTSAFALAEHVTTLV